MNSLDNLCTEITEQLESREEWSLTRDRVLELLGLDILDVYGLITGSTDTLVSFRTAEYSSMEPGVLVSLLECLRFPDAPKAFWKAGIWIPYEIQIELQEALLDEVVTARKSHSIEFDTFLAIFDHYSKFIRALQVYTDEFFSKEEFIESAVQTVLENHPETNAETALFLLKELAVEMVRREIIPLWNLLSPIFSRLKAYLIEMNRMAEPEEYDPSGGGQSDTVAGKGGNNRANARRLFDYGVNDRIEENDLKKRYKERMKKYHPDVNPKGLELSKEINLAYALLLSISKQQQGY